MSRTGQIPSELYDIYPQVILQREFSATPAIRKMVGSMQPLIRLTGLKLTYVAFLQMEAARIAQFSKVQFLLLFGTDKQVGEALFSSAQEKEWIRLYPTGGFYFDDSKILDSLAVECICSYDLVDW